MIESFSLKNTPPVGDLKITGLKSLNVIVGPQGCGKTTIMSRLTESVRPSNLELARRRNRETGVGDISQIEVVRRKPEFDWLQQEYSSKDRYDIAIGRVAHEDDTDIVLLGLADHLNYDYASFEYQSPDTSFYSASKQDNGSIMNGLLNYRDKRRSNTEKLIRLNGGRFEVDREMFDIGYGNPFIFYPNGDSDSKLLPENVGFGKRKLGTLELLLRNGALRKGMTLLLDDLDAGLHPKTMEELSPILFDFSESGLQIILSVNSTDAFNWLKLEAMKRCSDALLISKHREFFELGENNETWKTSSLKDHPVTTLNENNLKCFDATVELELEQP